MEPSYLEIDDGMKKYFKSLKHFKTLRKDEEHKLIEAYQKRKDNSARNKLIESNLKYTCKLANKYRGYGVSFDELIAEANDGLIEAIENFDLSQDVKLITYSKWKSIQKMEKAINDKLKTQGDSIDDIKYKDFLGTNENFIYDDNMPKDIDVDIQKVLNVLMEKLSGREKDMILKYFGIGENSKKVLKYDADGNYEVISTGYNLEEIGKEYGLTKERVRQIIEKSLTKLRSEAMMIDNVYLRE